MDPIAAVIYIYDAIHDNDVLEANERFNDLCDWIAKGGFVPASFEDLSQDMENLNLAAEEELDALLA